METDGRLDDRKVKILKAVIQNYLDTGEPVGSRTISKLTDLQLSSATIRNEMADLEELGYIVQPHTSAGRIPTDKGNNVILEIEIQGAMNIKRMFPDAVLMFITPPSAAELEKRLRGRGTEDEATIKARLSRAAEEAEGVEDYDYIVINDEVDLCVGRIHDIVLSEKMKAKYNLGLINNIKEELKVYSKGE
jgi:hypothetical protein